MSFEREVVVRHAAPARPADQVRSTLLQSSIASLRRSGHFDDYLRLLAPEHRATIVESLAPAWLPIEVGAAHYRACDALQLSLTEQLAMGETVGDRIQGTFLATMMKSARAAGFDPMVPISQFDRFWARVFQGSSVQVTRTGPKDIEVEVARAQLTRIAYFRTALAGVVRVAVKFTGVRTCHVKQVAYRVDSDSLLLIVAWV